MLLRKTQRGLIRVLPSTRLLHHSSPALSAAPHSATVTARELKLVEYGNADTGVQLRTTELSGELRPGQVLVELKAAPINPADINIIQGKYGVLPESLPANIGNEALFQVLASHSSNKSLAPGDLVLPMSGPKIWGAWRSHGVESESIFYKIGDVRTDDVTASSKHALATIAVNPPTAYRLLNGIVDLKPGETVIQNGANSGVGQAVIQLAKHFKINLVNIVRKRENQDQLNAYLKSLGAEHVFVEEDLRRSTVLTRDLWQRIPKPRLALNCVGGKATTDMMRLLDKHATMVTYGGMSKQPVIVNTADFIFKSITCRGFWLTEWKRENPDEYKKTLHMLVELVRGGQFRAPHCEEFRLDDYREAFKRVQTPFVNAKILFTN